MDSSTQTLVIILSVTLAVFLILAIIFVAYLIAIARQMQRIGAKAEATANTIEQMVATAQRAVAPAVASQFVMDQIKKLVETFAEKKPKRSSAHHEEEI